MNGITIVPYKDLHLAKVQLEEDREKARKNVERFVRAPATLRAYAHDWSRFEAWCNARNVRALPASDVDVAAHLAFLEALEGERHLSLSAIERTYCAIALRHRIANAPGWTPPRGYPADVMLELGSIRRKRAGTRRSKDALVKKDLLKIIRAASGDGLREVRDRAMLLLGFWTASRRSEIVALNVGDVQLTDDGVTVHLVRSKVDQLAEGYDKAALARDDELCPRAALRRWLELANVVDGAVFRGVNRWGHVATSALTAAAYADVVKARCGAVGFDPDRFAGHSLRSGFVTTAARARKPLDVIMKQTGHKDTRTVVGYIKRATLFDDNATEGL